MFLNDSFGNHSSINAIYNHHEQASAMAAVGYAKASNSFGVACVTTGCGCTNALTGVLDAWQDNVPLFVISGQVKVSNTSKLAKTKLRQFGVQEANIIPVVESITKYAVMLDDPEQVRYECELAAYLCKEGRSGPVWIDVPQDIQGALIDPESLLGFNQTLVGTSECLPDISSQLQEIELSLSQAKRPIILAGNGIRLANERGSFTRFVERLNVPVVFSYLSLDLLPTSHRLAIGRLGAKGDRAGNFAVQNADFILVLGCRLSVALTGFEYKLFGREAKISVVDIDPDEHEKSTVDIDNFYQINLSDFFEHEKFQPRDRSSWNEKCVSWRDKWPVWQERYRDETPINMYECLEKLSEVMPSSAHVVSDAGSAYYVTSQALRVGKDNRYHTSGAQADMGFTLPAAIGIASAVPNASTHWRDGDCSFQMNIQELQVLAHNKLNVKIVLLNNDGYLSIKTTQKKFFNSRFAGTGSAYGLSNPNFADVVAAYGIKFLRVDSPSALEENLRSSFQTHNRV